MSESDFSWSKPEVIVAIVAAFFSLIAIIISGIAVWYTRKQAIQNERLANNDDDRRKEEEARQEAERLAQKQAYLQVKGVHTQQGLLFDITNIGKCDATEVVLHYPFKKNNHELGLIEAGDFQYISCYPDDIHFSLLRVIWTDQETSGKHRTYRITSNGIGSPLTMKPIKLITEEGFSY